MNETLMTLLLVFVCILLLPAVAYVLVIVLHLVALVIIWPYETFRNWRRRRRMAKRTGRRWNRRTKRWENSRRGIGR